MKTKEFLRSVLGDVGHYCTVGIKNNRTVQNFHKSIDEVEEAANKLDRDGFDAYFALGTYVEPVKRKADNVQQLNSLFLDLDCGTGKPYLTQHDAIVALRGFCKTYSLPRPTLVNSGRGVHAYWPLTAPCGRDVWLPVATKLKAACAEHGLEADPAVTSDAARILRVPGTHNYKTGTPSAVQLLRMADAQVDITTLFPDVEVDGLMPVIPPVKMSKEDAEDMARAAGDDRYTKKFIKLATASLNGGGCKQIRRAFLEPDSLTYPQWLDVLSIPKHCTEDGATAIHVVSQGYKDYSHHETEKVAASIESPHLCVTFEKNNPGGCDNCPHKGKIRTPITLCREVREAESNEVVVPVEVQQVPEVVAKPTEEAGEPSAEPPVAPQTTQTINIPQYPKPYIRPATGGVAREVRDGEGNVHHEIVYDRDLYLTKRYVDPSAGPAYEVVHHTAREGIHRFLATALQLSGAEKFREHLTFNDVFIPQGGHKELMMYLSKWVKHLKETQDAIEVPIQFGWTKDHKSFVLGDREIFADKVIRNPAGSRTAQYFPHFEKRGTLAGWKEVIKFYNQPEFEEHQFMFGLSFGSPLMEMVPSIAGCIFHVMSSETGHGKTTGMWGGASVWGNHKSLVLHGGDTPNSVWNRAEVYKNLPLYVDEISNYPALVASNFVYAISDGAQRNRLSNSATNAERYRGLPWSLLCGTSGNGSAIQTISTKRESPKGEMGRMVEARVRQRLFGVEGALTANKLNDQLEQHFGHAGEIYIQFVLKNYDKIAKLVSAAREKITIDAGLEAQHRHWSAQAATVYIGLVTAKKLGLLDWDLDNLYKWIVDKLVSAKNALSDMNQEVQDTLGEFYSEHVRNILRIKDGQIYDEDVNAIVHLDNKDSPVYEWIGRHEIDVGKFYIRPSALKRWCSNRGLMFESVIESAKSNMGGEYTKIRMGRGTNLKLPQQRMFVVNWSEDG